MSNPEFSISLWQINTSPLPQPQSNLIAQKGVPCVAAIARARRSTRSVNGTSMAMRLMAVPRTATPASSNSPQIISNHGKVEAMAFNNKGFFTSSYWRTSLRKVTGSNAFSRPM